MTKASFGRFMMAALITTIISAILANLYNMLITSTDFAQLSILNITLTALITTFVGALVYYGLSRFMKAATMTYIILGIIFTLISLVPLFTNPPGEGFATAAIPLHLIVGIIAIIFIPWYVSRGNDQPEMPKPQPQVKQGTPPTA